MWLWDEGCQSFGGGFVAVRSVDVVTKLVKADKADSEESGAF